jgi:hypothetical protein
VNLKSALKIAGAFLAGAVSAVYLLHGRHPDDTRDLDRDMGSAYRVLSFSEGQYHIEHKGIVYIAKCRASLSWLEGTDKPAEQITDGDCTYMSSMVGKTIGDDLMRTENGSLVFSPWAGEDTLQTADYLTITYQYKAP